MEHKNTGAELGEVKHLVTNAMTSVTSLKDNVPSFWSGPAAVSYQDILTQSIDFSKLISLLEELEREIGSLR